MRAWRATHDQGRAIAAKLLDSLGAETTFVGVAEDRSPLWPVGYAGSITHGAGLAGVAVGRRTCVRGIGIDIEGVVSPAIAHDIGLVCLNERERRLVRGSANPLVASTICFSAKEAFFKCVYPVTRNWMDFNDVEVMDLDFTRSCLAVRLERELNPSFRDGMIFTGGFRVEAERVFTGFGLAPDGQACQVAGSQA